MKEEHVQKYIESWMNQDRDLFVSLLCEDVTIEECYGGCMLYIGHKEALEWFRQWNEKRTALNCEIIEHHYDEERNTALTTWYFRCLSQCKGEELGGITLVEVKDNKITTVKEYEMTALV